MKIIKKFAPRPSDEDDNSLGKIQLTDFVLEASTEDLNEMDQSSVIKLFVTLLKNHEEKIDLLIATQVETKVYSFMHSKYQQIKIGFTNDFETRRKRHEKDGWILLGYKAGSQQLHEKQIKRILKGAGQKPMPSSSEIFPSNSKVVSILIAAGWVGIYENRYKILQKDHQLQLI